MFTNSKLAKSIRLAMAFGAASTAMVASNSAIAQEAGAEESVEKIAVTGSRIRKADFVSNAPVATIGQEQFNLTATVNTESLLNTLPQVVPGLDRTSNNPGNGTATVDLRGLGTNRTLVLINGTRAVPTTAGGAVDINSIPTALIQDVEVLTGGASAIYGSDAVAGVVNFILKDDFEGVQTSVGYEVTDENDASIWSADFTIGGNFADGKGNVVFNMSYTDRDDLFQGDRSFAQTALFDDGAGGVEPGGSSGVPGTSIFAGGFSDFSPTSGVIFGQDGSVRPFVTSGEVNDFYNYAPVNYIQLPQERHQITALGSYEATENMEFYGRAMFTDSRVPSQLAPTPIFQTATFSLDNNPFLTPEAQQVVSDAIGLGVDTDGDGIDDEARALVRRRLEEVGPRRSEDAFNSYQLQVGIRGAIGDSSWSYDAYYQTGKVNNSTAQLGNVNRDRFNQALLLASEGGNVIVGADGQPTCSDTSENGSTSACMPMNIFGEGNISQGAADFLKTAVNSNAVFDSKMFAVTISGDTEEFFELPGGPIGVAMGYEHRDEAFEFLASQDLAAGTIAGFNGAAPLSGGYSVSEQYIEAYLPIFSGEEWADNLDLELAYRSADYSSVGNVTSYKVAGSWAPVEELRFRVGFNTAVRAPNIGELFAPRNEGFPGAADPCASDANNTSDAVRALCIATGVPADVVFSNAIDPASGQVRTVSGGNPNLNEEEAETLTIGFVAEPMEDFTFSLDYFDIEIEGAVGAFGGGTNNILKVCYDPADPRGGVGSAYCNSVNRRADGTIDFVEGAAQNVAAITLTGYDLIASYSMDMGAGSLSIDYLGTYTTESDFIPGPGEDPIKCAGNFGANCGEPVPEYKHRMTFKYAADEFTAQLLWRFVGEVNDDDDTTDFTVERIDGFNYFDASGTYYINDNYRVTAGIDNLFDKKPPVIGDNDEQSNTYPATYDVFGRTYYVKFTASF
ncbi:TonB-dependent receptor domain-containing protein [Aliiglaciecola litoralis]|uniref:TonB-dependent receptor n=1 Tax=Aliiglaciecola litoralis TaxID=582857 RepID=A0ABP3WZL3_9ALTE